MSAVHRNKVIPVSEFRLCKFDYYFDDGITKIDEFFNFYNYRTVNINIDAIVEIPPLPEGVEIELGWMNFLTESIDINRYGEHGYASGEIPELVKGNLKMVNTSLSGPWYQEYDTYTGPTENPQIVELQFKYLIDEEVSYSIPFKLNPLESLSFNYNKESCLTYLAVRDVNQDFFQDITTLSWTLESAIEVDLKSPKQKCFSFLGPCIQETPKIVPKDLLPKLERQYITTYKVYHQTFLWRPTDCQVQVIVAPHDCQIDFQKYLEEKVKEMTEEKFLLIQKKKLEGKEEVEN